jgi:hypothetical protein
LIPVTPLDAGDNSQAMACATSIGSTSRFIAAFRASRALSRVPEAMPASSAAVLVKPGDTALTRTPDRPHSAASVCVIWMTPAFAAV